MGADEQKEEDPYYTTATPGVIVIDGDYLLTCTVTINALKTDFPPENPENLVQGDLSELLEEEVLRHFCRELLEEVVDMPRVIGQSIQGRLDSFYDHSKKIICRVHVTNMDLIIPLANNMEEYVEHIDDYPISDDDDANDIGDDEIGESSDDE
jgi:hypothetical protein